MVTYIDPASLSFDCSIILSWNPSGHDPPFTLIAFSRIFLPSISSTFYVCVFCTKFWCQNVSKPKQSFVIVGAKILYKKCNRKLLIKLTPGWITSSKKFISCSTFQISVTFMISFFVQKFYCNFYCVCNFICICLEHKYWQKSWSVKC